MKPSIMSEKSYYVTLVVLIIAYLGLIRFFIANGKLLIWCAAPVIIFMMCKDAFTGVNWFAGRPGTIKQAPLLHRDTVPVSNDVKQGYLELMHLLVAPAYFPVLEPAIQKMKSVDHTNEGNTPLYSLADLADEHKVSFIMGLDWKADLENLDWRISSALKQNFNMAIPLPNHNLWPNDSSISADGVLKTYNDTLKAKGFELGVIDTQSDEYMLMVFKTDQKAQVQAAVKLTGYKYQDITSHL